MLKLMGSVLAKLDAGLVDLAAKLRERMRFSANAGRFPTWMRLTKAL